MQLSLDQWPQVVERRQLTIFSSHLGFLLRCRHYYASGNICRTV